MNSIKQTYINEINNIETKRIVVASHSFIDNFINNLKDNESKLNIFNLLIYGNNLNYNIDLFNQDLDIIIQAIDSINPLLHEIVNKQEVVRNDIKEYNKNLDINKEDIDFIIELGKLGFETIIDDINNSIKEKDLLINLYILAESYFILYKNIVKDISDLTLDIVNNSVSFEKEEYEYIKFLLNSHILELLTYHLERLSNYLELFNDISKILKVNRDIIFKTKSTISLILLVDKTLDSHRRLKPLLNKMIQVCNENILIYHNIIKEYIPEFEPYWKQYKQMNNIEEE